MPCYLHLSGDSFEVDSFIEDGGFADAGVRHVGEPISIVKPERGLHIGNSCNLTVSNSEFTDLKTQISDAIDFLQRNYSILNRRADYGVTAEAFLDFGIETRMGNAFTQVDSFPAELVKLAGDLSMGIELSQYQRPSEQ